MFLVITSRGVAKGIRRGLKSCGGTSRTHACLPKRQRRQVHSLFGENVEKNISHVGTRRTAIGSAQDVVNKGFWCFGTGGLDFWKATSPPPFEKSGPVSPGLFSGTTGFLFPLVFKGVAVFSHRRWHPKVRICSGKVLYRNLYSLDPDSDLPVFPENRCFEAVNDNYRKTLTCTGFQLT